MLRAQPDPSRQSGSGFRSEPQSGTPAIGRRIAKNVGGVLTRFIYHDEDMWMQLRADGWPERYYFHGPGIDEPLWTWQGEFTESYLYMPDALGTIRDMRNYTWTGNPIVASFTYDSFGQITSSSPPPRRPRHLPLHRQGARSGIRAVRATQ